MAGNQVQVRDIIEEIYFEINAHTQLAPTAIRPDPFADFPTWSGPKTLRFQALVHHLQKEYALIIMYSPTFVNNLNSAPDLLFNNLCNTIINYKASIRMFAWTRQLDFYTHFNASQAAVTFGILPEETPFSDKLHTHTYYLGHHGAIMNATWGNGVGGVHSLKNETENIYDEDMFSGVAKPEGWPNISFSSNPSQALKPGPPYPRCAWCRARVVAGGDCTCISVYGPSEDLMPLLEVIQHSFSGPRRSSRGVRALQSIPYQSPGGTFLGEYTGLFIPLHANHTTELWREPDFALEFEGPPDLTPSGRERGRVLPIATVFSAIQGNVTRFICEGSTRDQNNVEVVRLVVAGKLRLVVRTLRDIEFGEEIFADFQGRDGDGGAGADDGSVWEGFN